MRHLIIGNGPAGVTAAEVLRDQDANCRITLITREDVPFYSRCQLADYVEASVPRERLLSRPASFYHDLGIELHLNCVATALDAQAHIVSVRSGTDTVQWPYDRLLLATGSAALLPPIPGLQTTPGVFTLKTLTDAETLLAGLPAGGHAVVIGSGCVGIEVIQALARRGLQVTLIEAQQHVLPLILDGEVAQRVQARLQAHGIRVKTNSPAQAVIGGPTGVTAVRAGDEEIPCDLVVCAAGVRRDFGWIAGSGIATATGILVDSRMATTVPDIFAAGDLIEGMDSLGTTRRVLPTWPNAVNSGRIAGLNMAGVERHYRGLDAFNVIRIFELPLSSFGSRDGDRTVTRIEGTTLRRLTLRDGRIVGGQFYGDVDETGLLYELMNKRVDVSEVADKLLAPGFGPAWMMPPPPQPLRIQPSANAHI